MDRDGGSGSRRWDGSGRFWQLVPCPRLDFTEVDGSGLVLGARDGGRVGEKVLLVLVKSRRGQGALGLIYQNGPDCS